MIKSNLKSARRIVHQNTYSVSEDDLEKLNNSFNISERLTLTVTLITFGFSIIISLLFQPSLNRSLFIVLVILSTTFLSIGFCMLYGYIKAKQVLKILKRIERNKFS